MSIILLSRIMAASKLITIKYFVYITDKRTITLDKINQIDNRNFKKTVSKELA